MLVSRISGYDELFFSPVEFCSTLEPYIQFKRNLSNDDVMAICQQLLALRMPIIEGIEMIDELNTAVIPVGGELIFV